MSAAAAGGAAPPGGGGGGNGLARRIAEVSMDATGLDGVKGSVKVKHAKRRVTGGGGAASAAAAASGAQPLGGAVSEGPPELAAQARQVMSLTLTDREAPLGSFNKYVPGCGLGMGVLCSTCRSTHPPIPPPTTNNQQPTASRCSSTIAGRSGSTRCCSGTWSSPSRAPRRSSGSSRPTSRCVRACVRVGGRSSAAIPSHIPSHPIP
jgi:hypothetical protein